MDKRTLWVVLACMLALFGLRRRRRAALAACLLGGCFAATGPSDCPDHVCGGNSNADAGSTCKENWVCTSWEAPYGFRLAAIELLPRPQRLRLFAKAKAVEDLRRHLQR